MPKLKVDDADLNVDELEEAEYTESTRYHGEIPPKGTILTGRITKMWWTYTQSETEDPMLVVLFVAEDNTGKNAKFNGLPIWERLPLTVKAKFKWAPFFEVIGITIRDVKTKTVVEAEDDPRFGAPITKIATFEPGEDVSWVRVVTGTHRYEGALQVDADVWMEYEDPEESDAEDEETEEPEDVEVEEEPEPEEPAARGRTGRRTAAATPAKPAAKTPARGGRTATPAKPAAAPARGRRQSAAKGSDED